MWCDKKSGPVTVLVLFEPYQCKGLRPQRNWITGVALVGAGGGVGRYTPPYATRAHGQNLRGKWAGSARWLCKLYRTSDDKPDCPEMGTVPIWASSLYMGISGSSIGGIGNIRMSEHGERRRMAENS